jgi:hypothetical protein
MNSQKNSAGPGATPVWRASILVATRGARVESPRAITQPAEAIRYALTRWTALTRYRDDGQLEIDNNTANRRRLPLSGLACICWKVSDHAGSFRYKS